jgi:DNA-directed RNA polymerase subunit omega
MARVSIEDCLSVLENRFALVTVAASRTRQLMGGDEPLVKTKNKMAVTALREIAEGFVTSQDVPNEVLKVMKASAAGRDNSLSGKPLV